MRGRHGEKVMVTPDEAAKIKRVRYAYVVLALISCLTAFIAVQISLAAIRSNDHNFCELMNGLTVDPAQKPSNPVKDPRGERAWEIYQEVQRLSNRLGC